MRNLRFVAGMLSAALTVVGPGMVSGQEYPNKPIRIVTGTTGGGGDFTSRIVAQGISGPLGQPLVVDNRPSLLGAEVVFKAPPDGYTLFISGTTFLILPFLQKVPYDVADFSSISLLAREVRVLALHPSLPVKSVKELIALAKAKPGALNYASTGVGSVTHLTGELFKSMAGVNIAHIPYKGTAQAITALISGEVQMAITDAGVVMPNAKSGKLRALAIASAEPSALVPGLPTVAASGLPGFESVAMTSIFAPAKTPEAIIKRLNQEVVRVLNRADVKQKFFNAGAEVVGNSPEEFAATIKSEIAIWGKVIKDAGIKVE